MINRWQKKENGKWDLWWLFLMSLWFYGYSNPVYLLLILSSICVNFLLTGRITGNRMAGKMHRAKTWMWVGITFNLALIFYFKYYDFFISNMNALFQKDWTLKHIALPLGISFFTFQQISYVVDCYRQREPISYGFVEYAAYVTFFPQLVAGPIVMHSELVPQMLDKTKKKADYQNLSQGLYAFALGLGKKVLLADTLSKIVSAGYLHLGGMTASSAVVVMLAYTLQIYFDFSGYCDMALGISKMFNIDLPINFHSPYKAKSVSEFWERWHITLTRFFTHYVYIPLGGSRRGNVRTYVNTMLVFLLSGIWHGADWTFILWGVVHGSFMTAEKIAKDCLSAWKKKTSAVGRFLGHIYLFIFVNLTWIIFRAGSMENMKRFFQCFKVRGEILPEILEEVNDLVEVRMLYRLGAGRLIETYPALPCILLLAGLWLAVFVMKNTKQKLEEKKYGLVRSLVTIVLIVWSVISLSDVSEFLYFNF